MEFEDPPTQTMEADARKGPPEITARDIVFDCVHCGGELVVDQDGEGLEVPCPHCEQPVMIPAYSPLPGGEPADEVSMVATETRFDFTGFTAEQLGRRLEELKHQLKENRSQDMELRGHVNRATMELHRLQLRLQKLNDRHLEIESEIDAARRRPEVGM